VTSKACVPTVLVSMTALLATGADAVVTPDPPSAQSYDAVTTWFNA
jgi:hypothetical protein